MRFLNCAMKKSISILLFASVPQMLSAEELQPVITECSALTSEHHPTWKAMCTVFNDTSFTIAGSDTERANVDLPSANVFDYTNAKYYTIKVDGTLSEKKNFDFNGIDPHDVLFQTTNRKNELSYFVSKDAKKYMRYPKMSNVNVAENNWQGISAKLKSVVTTFPLTVDKNKGNETVILFHDGSYVLYDLFGKGKVLSTGKTQELFPKVKAQDISNITAALNLDQNIFLLLKDRSGFYVQDKNNTFFIKNNSRPEIVTECSALSSEQHSTWKAMCSILKDSSFTIAGSDTERANVDLPSANVFDYSNGKYYTITANGTLSEKKNFDFSGIDPRNVLFQTTNRKNELSYFVTKDAKKYMRYPKFATINVAENNWQGISAKLKSVVTTFPLSIDKNKGNETIIIFNDGSYVEYDLFGKGKVLSNGKIQELFPKIKTRDISNISAILNLDNNIFIILKDKSGFYVQDKSKMFFVKL